jgi:hypothetical protein
MNDMHQVNPPSRIRLNGWRRLWIVVAIIWAIPVFFFTISTVETEAKIKARWARDIVNLEKKYHSSFTWFEGKSDEEIIHPARSAATTEKVDLTDAELVTDQELAAQAVINQTYPEQLSELPAARTRTLLCGLLVWLVPTVALYFLGLACRWIYRGFRQRPSLAT